MSNTMEMANALQVKILNQNVPYTAIRVYSTLGGPSLDGHIGDIPISIRLGVDNYQVIIEQDVLRTEENLLLRGKLEQITTRDYDDSTDSGVVADSIINELVKLSLPYGDKKLLIPDMQVF